ncbi:MAG: hypothetical protein QG646_161 [Euryarchaeota archaeon]|nr:hypothetical protein [Euryarchaeota archaeon]
MRKRVLLLIPIFFALIFAGIYAHAIYLDAQDWRDEGQRYKCLYLTKVTGLSGREVQGQTVIMVPIPLSKEGKFFTPPAQKDPYFTQKFMHEVEHWPEQYRRGPHFENATEVYGKQQEIIGNWIPFIAETDKGYMLGFRTNETRLEDIEFDAGFVADYFDIFDPISKGSPLLSPIENVSNISLVPYGRYTIYASYPTYDTYVYLSNNLKGGENVSFNVYMDASNDPTEWPKEYHGSYRNEIIANVNDTGYVKVRAILGQIIPDGPEANYTLWYNHYGPVDYGNETDSNEETSYVENMTAIDDPSYDRK